LEVTVKSYGANIRCSVCGAEPYPDDPTTRETFELKRYACGWRCERNLPKASERRAASASAAADVRTAMGIDWTVTGHELSRAIPPSYSRFVAKQWLSQFAADRSAAMTSA
jgi:hypothetical protein